MNEEIKDETLNEDAGAGAAVEEKDAEAEGEVTDEATADAAMADEESDSEIPPETAEDKKENKKAALSYLVPVYLGNQIKKWKEFGVSKKHVHVAKVGSDMLKVTFINRGLVNIRKVAQLLKTKGVKKV